MNKNEIRLRRSHEGAPPGLFRHPVFAWLGLRAVWGQHTAAEQQVLRQWAKRSLFLVEVGVAEGASAAEVREAMPPTAKLWLVDPFHLSRVPGINATKRVAHKIVGKRRNGTVVWIEKFSFDAVVDWKQKIDFLFLDGDHSEAAVLRDWEEWHRFVIPGGVVAFHDAAVFPGGWTQPDWGPVRLIERFFRSAGLPEWRIVQEVDSLVVVQRCTGI